MGELTTLFDTSVLIGPTEGPPPELGGDCAISVVTVGELYAGVLLATQDAVQAGRLRQLAVVLSDLAVMDIGRTVSSAYGELRAAARRRPSNDLWIAATALAHDLELVTMDERQASLPLVRCTLIPAAG
jgi:predicted nucleic acid-binding protein